MAQHIERRRSLLKAWRNGLVMLLSPLAVRAKGSPTIPVYTYYDYPPFVTGDRTGLVHDLAAYLTTKADRRFRFQGQLLPRRRLDSVISGAWMGVVAWVTPTWFADPKQSKYAWSPVFGMDANYLVSPKARPVEVAQLSSLSGVRFGGIRGHQYPFFEGYFSSGRWVREDAPSQTSSLLMLMAGRFDLALISESSIGFYRRFIPTFAAQVHVSSAPLQTIGRRLFTPKSEPALTEFVDLVARGMSTDPAWREHVDRYR
jgi:polar amino acid transport system substrate-binding protein